MQINLQLTNNIHTAGVNPTTNPIQTIYFGLPGIQDLATFFIPPPPAIYNTFK